MKSCFQRMQSKNITMNNIQKEILAIIVLLYIQSIKQEASDSNIAMIKVFVKYLNSFTIPKKSSGEKLWLPMLHLIDGLRPNIYRTKKTLLWVLKSRTQEAGMENCGNIG